MTRIYRISAFAALALLSTGAHAVTSFTSFNQNVTNSVIFESGKANGIFTTDRANGVALGLRGKLRFDAENNNPQNIFNSNGNGTYSFAAGVVSGGFSFDPNSPTTPIWNFEWSINSNYYGNGENLNDLIYEIGVDFDPGVGTNFLTFDPINVPNADHSIGTNASSPGAGSEATGAASYAGLVGANNLAQNSWNMEFYNTGAFSIFNPTIDGSYDFFISAADGVGEIARVEASVIVGNGAAAVPEPGIVALMGLLGLAGLFGFGRCQRQL